jgi:hypothetical protein
MAQRVPVKRPDPVPDPEPVAVLIEAPLDADILADEFDAMLAVADELEESAAATISSPAVPASTPISIPRKSLLDLIGNTHSTPRISPLRQTVTRAHAWLNRHQLSVIASVVVIAVGMFGISYAWTRSTDLRRYDELKQVLARIDQQRRTPEPDFAPIRHQIERIIDEYPKALMREGAGRRNPVKQNLLFVSRDILPDMLKADLKTRTVAELHLASRLDDLGRALGRDKPRM